MTGVASLSAKTGILIALLACMPVMAHAEGGTVSSDGATLSDGTDAPAKPKVVHRRKKPAPAPVVAPKGPVPYSSLSPLPPSTVVSSTTVAGTPIPAEALTQPSESVPPPPPPPAAMLRPSTPQMAQTSPVAAPAEISLKCQTTVSGASDKTANTIGGFYIDLFPSPVFPDEHADFKFQQVDPAHKSLVRDSICLDTTCEALVSGSAYYLVNRVTRHGAALRITLDRATGTFYAEEIDKANLVGQGAGHTGEKGVCQPQKLPNALF